MTIHAGLGWRQVGMACELYCVMAIAAIDAKIAGMQGMAVGYRLLRMIPDISIKGGAEEEKKANYTCKQKQHSKEHDHRELVCPALKELCQELPSSPRVVPYFEESE